MIRRPSTSIRATALVLSVALLAGCSIWPIEKRLLSNNARIRASALKRVRVMPAAEREKLVKPMLAVIAEGEGRESHRAIEAIVAIGEPAIDGLTAALDQADPYLRVVAVAAIGEIGSSPESLVPTLVGALDDGHPLVREEAAHALGRLGPRAAGAVPALFMTLSDPKPEVQQAAAAALKRLGAKNVQIPPAPSPKPSPVS